jgi:hypothetical protein
MKRKQSGFFGIPPVLNFQPQSEKLILEASQYIKRIETQRTPHDKIESLTTGMFVC